MLEEVGGKLAGGLLFDPYGGRPGIMPADVVGCGGVAFFGGIPPASPGVGIPTAAPVVCIPPASPDVR